MPPFAAYLVLGAVSLAISRLHSHFGILTAIRAPFLLAVAATLALFASHLSWHPGEMMKHWVTKCIAFMACVAFIGVPAALYPGQSFDVIYENYSRSLMIGIMTWAVATTPTGVRLMARTLALSGLAAAWLAASVGRMDSSGRLSGGYSYDPNDLALILNVTMPLIVWWITDPKTPKWLRFGLVATIPWMVSILIKTDSRGGFLGAVAVVVGFLILASRPGASGKLRKFSLGIVVAAIVAFPFLPAKYRATISTIDDPNDYNRTSETGRIEVWKRGLGYATDHPLLGVGIGNFGTAEGRLSAQGQERGPGIGWKWSTAHNTYVQVAAELGLITGVVFLVMILAVTGQLLMRKPLPPESPTDPPNDFPQFLGVAMLAFAVNAVFLSFAYYDILYVLLGLAATELARGRAAARGTTNGRNRPRARRAAPVPGGRAAGQVQRRTRRA